MKPKGHGRGSLNKVHNPFERQSYEADPEFKESEFRAGEDPEPAQATAYTLVQAKSIVNRVNSPDVPHGWSLNPYQGCEHGCSYCYARNSHTYWGLDAGLDFERQILVKENAPQLLAQHFRKPSWEPAAIMLSGNTDCYQPLERKFALTRKLLEVFLEHRNPVGIITKNSLIERDLDLLKELQARELVQVAITVTTLNEDLRRRLEPRTASIKRRLRTIKVLSEIGVPVHVMMAPIIPGLNSHEVMPLAKAVAEAGARNISYTLLRLNGQLREIFAPWLKEHYPNHYDKVLNSVRTVHDGNLNDSEFGRRMHGSGIWADQVKQQMALARRKYFGDYEASPYKLSDFRRLPKGQYGLFDAE